MKNSDTELFRTMYASAREKVEANMEIHGCELWEAISRAKMESCAGRAVWEAIENDLADEEDGTEYSNVTLYINSDIYGVATIFCKSLIVEHREYAQYSSATYLTFKRPRSRNYRMHILGYDQAMFIVEGKAPVFENFSRPEPGKMMSAGRYASCDPRWASDMARHAAASGKVLYAQSKDGSVLEV